MELYTLSNTARDLLASFVENNLSGPAHDFWLYAKFETAPHGFNDTALYTLLRNFDAFDDLGDALMYLEPEMIADYCADMGRGVYICDASDFEAFVLKAVNKWIRFGSHYSIEADSLEDLYLAALMLHIADHCSSEALEALQPFVDKLESESDVQDLIVRLFEDMPTAATFEDDGVDFDDEICRIAAEWSENLEDDE